ncbi:1-acyl-sn-glycerol-3-phosphate acyltransferase [Alloiococcus otitis]|uniref:1-acylglycerol-3-phosphate O-acyltransferase n=1 Tax=Alloiococcus otitis ATCC 51267 TaxID=883081 RepID=K9EYH6_9LACT|nr:1-acyl-sn-glycerol-3-phosphate acyltransferase [Alloiococcus otitis]EKU94265.1 1-acylglycerol-3-phosphate O-acyltransferase [Alloiococcus otitis ATCC 51267]SUU81101.1 1-acyl-sn-glycerol-3-phosphate acyltransferase [Alloiococcus otitis]
MLFRFLVNLIYGLLIIVNGRLEVIGKENLPDKDTYVLVAPHRTWLDPVFIAIATRPREFVIMAKEELFNVPIFGWIIKKIGAFPVNRDKPGPSVIKTPVKALKESDQALMIFPTGTRHSTELKGGATTIAKLSKKPVITAVYDGPRTIKDLLKRKKTRVIFGQGFEVQRRVEGVSDLDQYYMDKMQASFDQLDQELKDRASHSES